MQCTDAKHLVQSGPLGIRSLSDDVINRGPNYSAFLLPLFILKFSILFESPNAAFFNKTDCTVMSNTAGNEQEQLIKLAQNLVHLLAPVI